MTKSHFLSAAILAASVAFSASAYAQQNTVLAKQGAALAQQAGGTVIMTGGDKGDYFLYFAPPLVKLLDKAWVDATVAKSDGTPDNMNYLVSHQKDYAILEGNVFGELSIDAKYAGKIKVLNSDGIGNEAIFAVMNPKTYERSQGSWAAIASHARQIRFSNASELSGPGRTFKQLMALDQNGLGKATNVVYRGSMDEAIIDVAEGRADVALVVQFGNPLNPRFKMIAEKGLNVAPVIMEGMRTIEIKDVGREFTLCENVQITDKIKIDTACTPMIFATGAENDNPDLMRVFSKVTTADFTPHDSGFAAFWKAVKKGSSANFDKALKTASDLADRAARNM